MPTNSKERGKDGKKDRNIDQLPPTCALTWSQTHNPGMYPDQESNLQPSGVQDNAPINRVTLARVATIFLMLGW